MTKYLQMLVDNIPNSLSLEHLAWNLNFLQNVIPKNKQLSHYIDLSNLPTFGGGVELTEGSYSWNRYKLLVYDNDWHTIDRDPF